MIKTKDEYLTALKTLIGDNQDDNVLEILEYANKIDGDKENEITTLKERITTLENEKTEIDTNWRKRYKDTFFTGKPEDDDPEMKHQEDVSRETKQDENYPQTYDDLFTEVKE